jgi:hypothetical protein
MNIRFRPSPNASEAAAAPQEKLPAPGSEVAVSEVGSKTALATIPATPDLTAVAAATSKNRISAQAAAATHTGAAAGTTAKQLTVGLTTASQANPLNFVSMKQVDDIKDIADKVLTGRSMRLATAGYSAPPEGYEAPTTAFLKRFVELLGHDNVGLVTSPTADKGSIDAISTVVGQQQQLPMLYVTAQDYVDYIKPENFPEGLDRGGFAEAPKHVFANAAAYSAATAEASNTFVATGGRDATVGDFVNAVKKGNRVVIIDNEALGGPQWDEKKSRPNNGAAYLSRRLAGDAALPDLPGKGFDEIFLHERALGIQKLVKDVKLTPDNLEEAAGQAALHVLGYDPSTVDMTKIRREEGSFFVGRLVFQSLGAAMLHQAERQAAEALNASLPSPRDFTSNNYEGFVQHDSAVVSRFIDGLEELVARNTSSSRDKMLQLFRTNPRGVVGRYLEGTPLQDAWYRLACTDAQGREWQQPAYARTPPDHAQRLNPVTTFSVVAKELDAAFAAGKWNEVIAAFDSLPEGERQAPGARIANEKYVVALNKTKQFVKALGAVHSYLHAHAPTAAAKITIAGVDAAAPLPRGRGAANGEILAAVGKIFRELSKKTLTSEEAELVAKFAGVNALTTPASDLARHARDLSTRYYEAGFFADRSYYAAINAAHNNLRAGNGARAERFAWMAQASMKDGQHGKADYWLAATQLEAALLTRDHKRIPELFAATAPLVTADWEAQTTANTIEDTFGAVRKRDGDGDRSDVASLVVGAMHELQANPQLGQQEGWVKATVAALELAVGSRANPASADTRLPKRYADVSERIFNRTVDVDWRHRKSDFDVLFAEAAPANMELRTLIAQLSKATGGEAIFPPAQPDNPHGLKGKERSRQRIADFGGDASQLTDIARGSIAFDSVDRLYSSLAFLDRKTEIVAIKDRFVNPTAGGYRDVLLKLRMSNGHVVELQLHLKGIIAVKNGEGHRLYEAQRDLWTLADKEKRSLTPEEKAEVEELNKQMRAHYDAAYASSLK